VDPRGEPGEFGGVLAVEGDVQTLAAHALRVHVTTRHVR
jgi:hypothetical protein